MGGHIGATWRTRLSHLSVAEWGVLSNYFDHLLFQTSTAYWDRPKLFVWSLTLLGNFDSFWLSLMILESATVPVVAAFCG